MAIENGVRLTVEAVLDTRKLLESIKQLEKQTINLSGNVDRTLQSDSKSQVDLIAKGLATEKTLLSLSKIGQKSLNVQTELVRLTERTNTLLEKQYVGLGKGNVQRNVSSTLEDSFKDSGITDVFNLKKIMTGAKDHIDSLTGKEHDSSIDVEPIIEELQRTGEQIERAIEGINKTEQGQKEVEKQIEASHEIQDRAVKAAEKTANLQENAVGLLDKIKKASEGSLIKFLADKASSALSFKLIQANFDGFSEQFSRSIGSQNDLLQNIAGAKTGKLLGSGVAKVTGRTALPDDVPMEGTMDIKELEKKIEQINLAFKPLMAMNTEINSDIAQGVDSAKLNEKVKNLLSLTSLTKNIDEALAAIPPEARMSDKQALQLAQKKGVAKRLQNKANRPRREKSILEEMRSQVKESRKQLGSDTDSQREFAAALKHIYAEVDKLRKVKVDNPKANMILKNQIKTLKGQITRSLKGLPTDVDTSNISLDVVRGLSEGLADNIELLKQPTEELADAIIGHLKRKLKIKSPSKVASDIGYLVGVGLGQGLKYGLPAVYQGLKALSVPFKYFFSLLNKIEFKGKTQATNIAKTIGHALENMTSGMFATNADIAKEAPAKVKNVVEATGIKSLKDLNFKGVQDILSSKFTEVLLNGLDAGDFSIENLDLSGIESELINQMAGLVTVGLKEGLGKGAKNIDTKKFQANLKKSMSGMVGVPITEFLVNSLGKVDKSAIENFVTEQIQNGLATALHKGVKNLKQEVPDSVLETQQFREDVFKELIKTRIDNSLKWTAPLRKELKTAKQVGGDVAEVQAKINQFVEDTKVLENLDNAMRQTPRKERMASKEVQQLAQKKAQIKRLQNDAARPTVEQSLFKEMRLQIKEARKSLGDDIEYIKAFLAQAQRTRAVLTQLQKEHPVTKTDKFFSRSIGSIRRQITNDLKGLPTDIDTSTVSKEIIKGLSIGLERNLSLLEGSSAEVGAVIKEQLERKLEIKSPSRVAQRIGENVVKTLGDVLKRGSKKVKRGAEAVGSGVTAGVTDGMTGDNKDVKRRLAAMVRYYRRQMTGIKTSFIEALSSPTKMVALLARMLTGGALIGAFAFLNVHLTKVAVAVKDLIVELDRIDTVFRAIGYNDVVGKLDDIYESAQRVGIGFNSLIEGTMALRQASMDTTLEPLAEQVAFDINRGAAVRGLNSQQVESLNRAVTQIMSKGTVQSEELRGQIGEALPGAFQIAARAIGKTTAELGKLLELGHVAAEDFLPKFSAALGRTGAIAQELALDSVSVKIQKVENVLAKLRLQIALAFSPFYNTIISNSVPAIEFLGESIGGLIKLFRTLITMMLVTGVATFIKIANATNLWKRSIKALKGALAGGGGSRGGKGGLLGIIGGLTKALVKFAAVYAAMEGLGAIGSGADVEVLAFEKMVKKQAELIDGRIELNELGKQPMFSEAQAGEIQRLRKEFSGLFGNLKRFNQGVLEAIPFLGKNLKPLRQAIDDADSFTRSGESLAKTLQIAEKNLKALTEGDFKQLSDQIDNYQAKIDAVRIKVSKANQSGDLDAIVKLRVEEGEYRKQQQESVDKFLSELGLDAAFFAEPVDQQIAKLKELEQAFSSKEEYNRVLSQFEDIAKRLGNLTKETSKYIDTSRGLEVTMAKNTQQMIDMASALNTIDIEKRLGAMSIKDMGLSSTLENLELASQELDSMKRTLESVQKVDLLKDFDEKTINEVAQIMGTRVSELSSLSVEAINAELDRLKGTLSPDQKTALEQLKTQITSVRQQEISLLESIQSKEKEIRDIRLDQISKRDERLRKENELNDILAQQANLQKEMASGLAIDVLTRRSDNVVARLAKDIASARKQIAEINSEIAYDHLQRAEGEKRIRDLNLEISQKELNLLQEKVQLQNTINSNLQKEVTIRDQNMSIKAQQATNKLLQAQLDGLPQLAATVAQIEANIQDAVNREKHLSQAIKDNQRAYDELQINELQYLDNKRNLTLQLEQNQGRLLQERLNLLNQEEQALKALDDRLAKMRDNISSLIKSVASQFESLSSITQGLSQESLKLFSTVISGTISQLERGIEIQRKAEDLQKQIKEATDKTQIKGLKEELNNLRPNLKGFKDIESAQRVIANLRLDLLEAEQTAAIETLALEKQKAIIAKQTALNEAKIASLRAKQDLFSQGREFLAGNITETEFELSKQIAKLADVGVGVAEKDMKSISKLFDLRARTLDAETKNKLADLRHEFKEVGLNVKDFKLNPKKDNDITTWEDKITEILTSNKGILGDIDKSNKVIEDQSKKQSYVEFSDGTRKVIERSMKQSVKLESWDEAVTVYGTFDDLVNEVKKRGLFSEKGGVSYIPDLRSKKTDSLASRIDEITSSKLLGDKMMGGGVKSYLRGQNDVLKDITSAQDFLNLSNEDFLNALKAPDVNLDNFDLTQEIQTKQLETLNRIAKGVEALSRSNSKDVSITNNIAETADADKVIRELVDALR